MKADRANNTVAMTKTQSNNMALLADLAAARMRLLVWNANNPGFEIFKA